MPCSTFPARLSARTGRRGNLASLFVRGGESNYNKVLVDGVPVNDPGGIFDFGVVPMNNVERLEVERGPESTVYGSDAMTSVVQLWTATGSTRTPEIQFGADGGNFSTANGYASVAGARSIFDYNVFANQFNTQGQGSERRLFEFTARRKCWRAAFRPRSISAAHRHYNSWTGIQSNWWFNGNPELPPDPNQYAHQNNFLASGDLTVSGPGAWQHQFSGFEYHHVALNVNPVDDLDRPFDSAFNSLAKYNRAGFAYQGIYTPRPWAQTTRGLQLRRRERIHQQQFGRVESAHTHGLRFNNYLFAQQTIVWRRLSVLAGVGYVNNSSFGGKVSPRASAVVSGSCAATSFFSGTRLHAGYSQGIKEPSFEQTFGITGTFPTLAESQSATGTEPGHRSRREQSLFNNRAVAQRRVLPQSVSRPDRVRIQLAHQHQPVRELQPLDGAGRRSGVERPALQPSVGDRRLYLHFDPDSASAAVRSRMRVAIRASTAPARRCCGVPSKLACCC